MTMQFGLLVLVVTLVSALGAADSAIDPTSTPPVTNSACCFSDTFKMDGTFHLLYNVTGGGPSPGNFHTSEARGKVTVMGDFADNKFAATLSFEASTRTEREDSIMQSTTSVILDASRTAPLFYSEGSSTAKGRRSYNHQGCSYRSVSTVDKIAEYQCVARQILQGGDVSDGRIRMRLNQRFPSDFADKLEIQFDQETCTPSLVHLDYRPNAGMHLFLTLKAESDTSVTTMPDIPDDLSQCRRGSVTRVHSADGVPNVVAAWMSVFGLL